MASQTKARRAESAEAQRAPAQRAPQPAALTAQQSRSAQPAAALQRFTGGTRAAVSASDVLTLQRTYGNAAVGRIIAARSASAETPHAASADASRTAPASSPASGPVVQPKLTVTRPVVQMRGGKSAAKFGTPNWAGLPVGRAHVMDGEVKDNEPKGLHAYTNEALPGITVLKTLGNVNAVHILWWTKGTAVAARKAKWSSMFPKRMSEGMVTAVLQRAEAKSGGFPKEVDTSAEVGVPFGKMTIGKSGDTMYPVRGSGGATDAATVTHNQVQYAVANHTGD